MKKMDELLIALETAKQEAQNLLDQKKIEETKNKMQEIKDLKSAIEMQKELDKEQLKQLESEAGEKGDVQNRVKETANAVRAIIKKTSGKMLTEAENSLLLPSTSSPNGENGESYILPQDVSTKIREKLRSYRAMREVVGYMPAGAMTGSYPVENFETVSELVDFSDGTELSESDDISFTNVSYALKEKAAFISLSNTLLAMTDNDLISYVVQVFSKKALVTENKLIIAKLKEGKTAKVVGDYKDVKSLINKTLDPSMLTGTKIVTNQDGFDWLDQQEDGNKRPLLQPSPSDATKKMFGGYTIEVYSNGMLPNASGKYPLFIGNLTEAVDFVDYKGLISFATSTHAGFTKNITLARLIEFIDVIKKDNSDKCYCYVEVSPASPTEETGK